MTHYTQKCQQSSNKKGKEAIITEALSSGKQQAAEKDYYTLYTCY